MCNVIKFSEVVKELPDDRAVCYWHEIQNLIGECGDGDWVMVHGIR